MRIAPEPPKHKDDTGKITVKVSNNPPTWILVPDNEEGRKRAARFTKNMKQRDDDFYTEIKVKNYARPKAYQNDQTAIQ